MPKKGTLDLNQLNTVLSTDVIEVVHNPGSAPESMYAEIGDIIETIKDDADLDDAITKKHTQGTDSGTTATSFSVDSGGSIVKKAALKTSGTISITVGSGGDYTTFAEAIAVVPKLLAHNVTITILAGTTLTEQCNLTDFVSVGKASITVCSNKYYPTTNASSAIPTADSGAADGLIDAALVVEAYGDDYFNGCWVLIVDGTGTDNGFVPIADYTDSTGKIHVASWPGTQPDDTSRYIIVGALVDGSALYNGIYGDNLQCVFNCYGIGVKDSLGSGMYFQYSISPFLWACGVNNTATSGYYAYICERPRSRNCGFVGCNTSSSSIHGGIRFAACTFGDIRWCGISDNDDQGVIINLNGYTEVIDNFGDANGTYGTVAADGGVANCSGTECSGSSGDHTDDSIGQAY